MVVNDVFVMGNRVTMNLELCRTIKPPKINAFITIGFPIRTENTLLTAK